jgi:hypothetical protein
VGLVVERVQVRLKNVQAKIIVLYIVFAISALNAVLLMASTQLAGREFQCGITLTKYENLYTFNEAPITAFCLS